MSVICCRVYISIQEQIYQFCEKRKVLSFFVEDCWKGEFDSLNWIKKTTEEVNDDLHVDFEVVKLQHVNFAA